MVRYNVLLGFIAGCIFILSSRTGVFTDRSGSPVVNGATCDGCHNGGSFKAEISLSGFPGNIQANDTIDLSLNVSNTNARGAGFQVVALDDATQNYVGEWIKGLGSKKASNIGITHDLPRGFTNGKGGWSFKWVSPPFGGPFTFYYAVNLVNLENNTTGDNPVTGSTNVLLPVKYSEFIAFKDGKYIMLKWSTEESDNNDFFEIQKLTNSGNFISIGKIDGHNDKRFSYHFQDKQPNEGMNYYRIRQVDNDKSFSYSAIHSVEYIDSKDVVFFNSIRKAVEVKSPENVTSIDVYDLNGRILLSKRNSHFMELPDQMNGVYIITANVNGSLITERLFIY